MPRLFIAIDFPPPIPDRLAAIRVEMPGVKWTPADQFHLTLNFIGEVERDAMEKIKNALKAVGMTEFSLTLRNTGFFPNKRRPSVFWLGLEENPRLNQVKTAVDQVLVPLGFPPEARKFVPHLTLARLKRETPANIAERLLETVKNLPPLICQIDNFYLYSSLLTETGAVHTREAAYP